MPDSTKRRSVALTTSTASAICPAARPAAAAGLLSSCASPAAIVPSDVNRSRLCSIAVTRLMTGATCCITRRCTAGCESASRRNSAGSTTAMRQAVSACMRTPIAPSVSALIAPIQVGAMWRPAASTRSPEIRKVSIVPCSTRYTPAAPPRARPGSHPPRPPGCAPLPATPRVADRPARRTDRSPATRPEVSGAETRHASARYW